MRTTLLVSTLACLLAWSPLEARPAQAARPVVVELYTSQGCSACLKADDLLSDLAARKGVLALTFSVDYWDYLGWPDTFAKPEFSARQRAYVKTMAGREVYTPQIVVDGRGQASAVKPEAVEALIQKARRARKGGPQMAFLRGDKVTVRTGRAPNGGAEIWAVRYQRQPQDVIIKGGENRGHTATYQHVVRQIDRLGVWSGRARVFALPPANEPDLKTVILAQVAGGGRVLAVLQK